MKKIFTLFAATGISIAAFAQCTVDFTNTVNGLSPSSDSIPCVTQGTPYDQTIQIYVPASVTVSGIPVTITSVRVDSIKNLPCGLRYAFNELDRTFTGAGPDNRGCLKITGTTSDPVGQYQLKVGVTLNTTLVSGSFGDASAIPGIGGSFKIFVRVKGSGACAAIDTSSAGLTSSCANAKPDYTNIPTLEEELAQLTISPIPAVDNLDVRFTADKANEYTYTLTNMVGAVVASSSIKAEAGENNFSVSTSTLNNGVYFITLRRGDATLTKKIVVSH